MAATSLQEKRVAALAFEMSPYPTLLISVDLLIIGCNQAYLQLAETKKSMILGRYLFEVYPENMQSPKTRLKRYSGSR